MSEPSDPKTPKTVIGKMVSIAGPADGPGGGKIGAKCPFCGKQVLVVIGPLEQGQHEYNLD